MPLDQRVGGGGDGNRTSKRIASDQINDLVRQTTAAQYGVEGADSGSRHVSFNFARLDRSVYGGLVFIKNSSPVVGGRAAGTLSDQGLPTTAAAAELGRR